MKRALVMALLLAGCRGDSGLGPTPGILVISLTRPGTTDGAVVLTLSGGPVTAVHAPAGYQITSNSDGAGTHVLLVGDLRTGTVATVEIPDIAQALAYVAAVEQVADRTTFALLDAGPYRATITVGP